MRIAKNVEMLEVVNGKSRMYPVLLWDDENIVLIDTGFPLQYEFLNQAVQSAGFDIKQINKIIFTHQDIDHIGCAKEIIAEAENVQTMAHKNEAPYIDGSETPVKLIGRENDEAVAQLFSAFKNRRINIDKLLNDGDTLPYCGGIEVIHTPGHTPGHICLFLKESGVLVAGDALNISDGTLTGPNPVHTQNMELALASLRKLHNYQVKAVVSYHGGLYEGGIK